MPPRQKTPKRSGTPIAQSNADTLGIGEAYQTVSQIVEGSPVATFVLDMDGTVTHWNNMCARLLQTPANKVLGKKSPWVSAYEDARPVLANLVMHQQTEEIAHYYGERAKPSDLGVGAYEAEDFFPRLNRWLHFTAVPLRDCTGKVIGAIETLQDISAHKEAQQTLTEARQLAESAALMKAEFVANMSHELRTPINAVIGLAHLLQKTELAPRQQDYTDKIRDAGNMLLGLVNDILDFSKIEAGHMHLERASFALEKTLDSVASIIQHAAQDKGLELHFVIEPEVPAILVGDPLRLSQVLTNLISNAVKFTEQGFVTVFVRCLQAREGKCQLEFSVQDTGIGMDETQLARLFQAFTQADTSTTRQFGGTGLGLVICQRLVEMMGGKISVHSQPDLGSTFSFAIWLDTQPQAFQPIPTHGLRALVVDDQPIARTVLTSLLNKQGLSVTTVESGQAALDIATQPEAEPFDWLFLDWKMPDMSGTDLAARIRNHYRSLGKPVRVVLVTAASPDQLDVALRSGLIDHVLGKPVFPAQLHALLTPPKPVSPLAEADAPLQGLRVLVVEDIATNRLIARELLESLGATVLLAENGKLAVDLLRKPDCIADVVLMDIQMPIMDGLQAARLIRQQISASLPVIAMTAHASNESRSACKAAGMSDFLAKPIEPEKLLLTLQQWQAQSRNTYQSNHIDAPTEISAHPQTCACPPEEWDLPGIDVADGLRRMMNKPALYEKVLRDFHQRFYGEVDRIREHLCRGETAEATRCAHSLKGLAGSISAIELFGTARLAEHAISSGEDAETALSEMAQEHQRVLNGISRQFSLKVPDLPPATVS